MLEKSNADIQTAVDILEIKVFEAESKINANNLLKN